MICTAQLLEVEVCFLPKRQLVKADVLLLSWAASLKSLKYCSNLFVPGFKKLDKCSASAHYSKFRDFFPMLSARPLDRRVEKLKILHHNNHESFLLFFSQIYLNLCLILPSLNILKTQKYPILFKSLILCLSSLSKILSL